MTKIAEDSQWYRGKRGISKEYLNAFFEIERAVGGRGFLYRPGYLGDAITQLETASKFKLSELNYDIVAKAIERELAQTGHEYDIAYKEALIAWELEKTATLTALDQEFADLKYNRGLDMAALDQLELEVNLRKLVIIAEKADIKAELEALDLQMVGIKGQTLSQERILMNEKWTTAAKKLEVIPYIEIILAKQEELLAASGDNVDRKESLITAKEGLIDKKEDLITAREAIVSKFADLIAAREDLITAKEAVSTAKQSLLVQETITVAQIVAVADHMTLVNDAHKLVIQAKRALLPYMVLKVAAQDAYNLEVAAWIIVKEAIADVKEDIAALKEIEGDNKALIMAQKTILNGLELALEEARLNLQMAKLTGHNTITTTKMSELGETLTKETEVFTRELTEESTMRGARVDASEYVDRKMLQIITDVNNILIPSEKKMITRILAAQLEEMEDTAEIASGAELTSELIHLLG